MGRKRRARGFHFDSFEHERRRSALAAWQPWPWPHELVELNSGGETGMTWVELMMKKLSGTSPWRRAAQGEGRSVALVRA